MKKVLKNILKWLICVLLTFAVTFTVSQSLEIAEGLYLIVNGEETIQDLFANTEMIEGVRVEEENINNIFNYEGEDENIKELYNQYPVGTSMILVRISYMLSYGNIAFVSLMLGLIIGTAIYLLFDKDKKGLTYVIVLYILSVVILGFVQGVQNIYGDDLTILDKWIFPDEYIIPVSIAFVAVVVIRVVRQKKIAKELNKKLEEKKSRESVQENEQE